MNLVWADSGSFPVVSQTLSAAVSGNVVHPHRPVRRMIPLRKMATESTFPSRMRAAHKAISGVSVESSSGAFMGSQEGALFPVESVSP